MKKNELMINDWFTIDDEPIKVESVYDYSYKYRVNDDNIYAEALMPIPLDRGILEANGWSGHYCSLGDEPHFLHPECHFVLQYHFGAIYVSIQQSFFAKVTYVHELQHALRLCGLSELADNFKLKMEE